VPHQLWVFYLNPMTTETPSEIHLSYKPGLCSSTSTITNSQNAFEIFKSLFPADTISLQEQFVVLYLDRANKVIGSYPLSKAGIKGTITDVKLRYYR
jgi:DNA repair protein RadC